MQIFFSYHGDPRTMWNQMRIKTCTNFKMSFVKSKIWKFFHNFLISDDSNAMLDASLLLYLRIKNNDLLSSFPLRSGISKPVFPIGDTLRSVGKGRPLVLSSESWYICLCMGCRCQFSPKRCMAAKSKHMTTWELENFTRNTKIISTWSKRQFSHKKGDSCERK